MSRESGFGLKRKYRHVFKSWEDEKRLMEEFRDFYNEQWRQYGSLVAKNEAIYFIGKVAECNKFIGKGE